MNDRDAPSDSRPRRRRGLVTCATAAAVLLAVSCSPPSPPPAPQATRAEPVPTRDLVAEVRAAAEGEDALDVQPLRDPDAEDFYRAALRLQAAGRLDDAEATLQQALAIAPEDPELLQFSAEIALARGDLDAAEQRAWAAYEHGPQLGPLCRRNWAAIRLARELRGNAEAALQAREQAGRCAHQPPVRM